MSPTAPDPDAARQGEHGGERKGGSILYCPTIHSKGLDSTVFGFVTDRRYSSIMKSTTDNIVDILRQSCRETGTQESLIDNSQRKIQSIEESLQSELSQKGLESDGITIIKVPSSMYSTFKSIGDMIRDQRMTGFVVCSKDWKTDPVPNTLTSERKERGFGEQVSAYGIGKIRPWDRNYGNSKWGRLQTFSMKLWKDLKDLEEFEKDCPSDVETHSNDCDEIIDVLKSKQIGVDILTLDKDEFDLFKPIMGEI
ncbi:uncharacterized protein IL334_002156 [Kwoniella shivajii]|uniref:Uncharacterized protein n=1 Tax=Kwoniella shivajii TaxID=564305 RepID=A0ABZ1CTX6_9TREE|nr:hypothetical protein IL334_002156 [Kwoniella shivajii]